MRTVDYSDVLRGSAALAGLQPEDLAATEFALFRTFHDRRLQLAWEIHRWPEICRYEQRAFRDAYDPAKAYAAGDEVFDVASGQYFQALQASTGQAPTTGSVVNGTYWALGAAAYTGDDYVAGVNDSGLALGSIVRYPATGLYYQLFAYDSIGTSIWIAGAGVAEANGLYSLDNPMNGKNHWSKGDYNGIYWEPAAGAAGAWIITRNGLDHYYMAESQTASPADATGWTAIDINFNPNPANNPVPTSTPPANYGVPTNTANWGRLTPFNRYIPFEQTGQPAIGEVLAAWDRDPRLTTKVTPLPVTISAEGFQFAQLKHAVAQVWLLFRIRRPELTGDAWDATAVYTSGCQVYFADAAGAGNFYDCLATTVAGESPATAPAKWQGVPLPYTFRQYLIQGGYADWLTSDGQTDKAGVIEATCAGLLELEADKLQRQQGQVNRMNFRS